MMNYDDLNMEYNGRVRRNFCMPTEWSQDETIQYLLGYANMSGDEKVDEEFEACIENGICYMLSMEWLRLIKDNDGSWCTTYGTYEDVLKQTGYYKQIANNFVAYASENGTRKKLIPVWNNEQIAKELIPLGTRGKLNVIGQHRALNAEALRDGLFIRNYMFIELNMKDGGHAVAAYWDGDKNLYFYDPNYGVIAIKAQTEEELRHKAKILMMWLFRDYEVLDAIVRFLE